MIRRTVEISRQPCHLAVRDGQLLVLSRTEPPRALPAHPENLAGRLPLEDLGVLMVDQRDTTYTHSVLVELAQHGGALVVCGPDHLPCGMFLPWSSNTELLGRLDAQLSASRPRRKRLWASLVAAKVRAQARNLDHAPDKRSHLLALARRVRSGDPTNVEAQAARAYWPAIFDDLPTLTPPFRRRPGDRAAPPPNNLLDYGYAVLRAAVARAIVSAGLLPALGLQHRQRSNPFCLADDLVEPLRPMVDARARALALQGRLCLDQPTKAELLTVLTATVRAAEVLGPLEVALTRYVASLVRALTGEAQRLDIPVETPRADHTPAQSAEEDDDACT